MNIVKKIASGYARALHSFALVLAVIGACFAFSFAIVYPLWLFATSEPQNYTKTICVLAIFALFLALIFRFKKSIISAETKQNKIALVKKSLIFVAKVLTLSAGLLFFCFFIIKGLYLAAIFCLVALVILYGILAFGTKK